MPRELVYGAITRPLSARKKASLLTEIRSLARSAAPPGKGTNGMEENIQQVIDMLNDGDVDGALDLLQDMLTGAVDQTAPPAPPVKSSAGLTMEQVRYCRKVGISTAQFLAAKKALHGGR